jgi:ferritin
MKTKLKTLNELQSANPADVMIPVTLDPQVVLMLTERLKDEYTAHYFYRNAANWCADKGYLKATAFFTQEAANELTHAEMLQKYMVDWNVLPVIAPIKLIPDFTNLIDIVNKAYKLELDLLLAYNNVSTTIFSSDLSTFDFLQTLRTGQVESVAEYSDLLNAAQLINVANSFEILYYEQTYF